jgi:hypothetical protein
MLGRFEAKQRGNNTETCSCIHCVA